MAEETTETTATTTPPGVLRGGWLTRVRVPDPSSPSGTAFRWYQIYEWPPGSRQFIAYQYNDAKQAIAAHGELPYYRTWDVATFDRVVVAEASAEEVIGRSGSFQVLADEMMKEAALAAGVRDPGLVGQIANDPEMQQIMVQAMIGDWTPEQIRAAQRNTNLWKNTLYPGIENLYNLTQEPERAYADYMNTISPALEALGYQRNPDGTFKQQIKTMLDKKIDAGTFLSQVPTFVRATQNAEFASALNQWAELELGRDITFNDWFDLLAGESAPEIEAVAEKATLAWVAQNQGAQVGADQISRLAARSQLTPDEAVAAFSEFNQSILALGDEGLARYGLTRDEVLSAAAGVNPQTGRSIDEVRLAVAKTARELDMFDEEKINFYVGFSPTGTPIRPGLQTLAPEGA